MAKVLEREKKKEDWMNSKWRPMMGWMYMVVCFMDFVGFPVLWSLLQAYNHGQVSSQWQPLTLQGAGLFHLAMGAVIGISAYGRTQEKLGGANNGGIQLPPGAGTTYVPPTGGITNGNTATPTTGFSGGAPAFGAPAANSFGNAGSFGVPAAAPTAGFGTTSPGFGAVPPAAVTTGFSGKPAPVIPPFPEK
jgi:hypothetical protein